MPKFIDANETFRILQRELPEGVYPDGSASAYFATADHFSAASGIASSQANLERIYDNYWPQTADERIADWEITAFAKNLPTSLSLAERRDRVLTKLRSRKGLTIADMKSVVLGIVGSDKVVDIIEWGCSTGGWILNESQLDIETYLNGHRLSDASGETLCNDDPSDHGKTEEEWLEMKEEAYTYEVLIYDYTLTSEEETEIDEALDVAEPARSNHVITSGLDSSDILDGED